jgi:hypothetical protein
MTACPSVFDLSIFSRSSVGAEHSQALRQAVTPALTRVRGQPVTAHARKVALAIVLRLECHCKAGVPVVVRFQIP